MEHLLGDRAARCLIVAATALLLSCDDAAAAHPSADAGDASEAGTEPVGGPNAPEVAGERAGDDASLRAHADAVASYTMRVSLDPASHELRGEATIAWRNASRVAVRELWLHLYLNAFASPRTAFLREPVGGFRGASALRDFGRIDVSRFYVRELEADLWPQAERSRAEDPDDETDVRIPLPRDVAPGEALAIEVAWTAHLPALLLRTGHSGTFHMVGQWFPKLARLEPDGRWAHFPFRRLAEFYADFGTYDVTVDVPEGFRVGATGELRGEERETGRVRSRFVQADVHDFAFAAWDGFEERRRTSAGGVVLRALFPRGHDRAAEVELDAAEHGLSHFGRAYGRYPYATLTLVHPPDSAAEAGGMEYPTLITTGGAWYLPWTGVRLLEVVTLHELGHQWFYGLVATNEHEHPFLDEGLTSFAELDAMEACAPGASAASVLGIDVSLHAVHRVVSAPFAQNDEIAQPAAAFASGGDYGALVYSRTATVLATLGRVYGPDLLRGALGRYARAHRFEHPRPEDLVGAIAEGIGPEAADALRLALFERGWVDFAVETFDSRRSEPARDTSAAKEGTAAAAAQPAFAGEVLVRRRGTLRLPVDVLLVGESGATQLVRWEARESAARLAYAGESPLVAVVIDPERKVLLDERLDDNARRLAPSRLAPRVLERASFGAAVLQLLGAP